MPATKDTTISVLTIERGEVSCAVIGQSPVILYRLSEKAKGDLLLPGGPKDAATKAATPKHDVLREFRDSPHYMRDADAPTRLGIPAAAFKKALSSAAIDLPGAKKAQIGRLTYVPGDKLPVWGVPQLMMSPVRMQDMNHTLDIRTKAILPRWATIVTIRYVLPILREQPVMNLFAAAGEFIGVGDWRPEKGSGSFGRFRLVGIDDPEFLDIQATGGRAVQEAAMERPEFYDDESRDLFAWYQAEIGRRGFKGVDQ